MKVILIGFIFLSTLAFSQRDSSLRISHGIRYMRMDFFVESSVIKPGMYFNHEFGLGFGVNCTVFQRRVFPELYYRMVPSYVQWKNVEIKPTASFHSSFLNTNKKTTQLHFFEEVMGGLYLSFGSGFRTCFIAEIGYMSESFRSDLLKKVSNNYLFTYSTQIRFTYAF